MARFDGEIDEELGSFIANEAKYFTPLNERFIDYYVDDPKYHNISTIYRNKEQFWRKKKEKLLPGLKFNAKLPYRIVIYYIVPTLFWAFMLSLSQTRVDDGGILMLIADSTFYTALCNGLLYLFDTAFFEGFWLENIENSLMPNDASIEKKYKNKNPYPAKPEGYPFPKIRKTKQDTGIYEDSLYERYLSRKKEYQTTVNCTICNSSIKILNVKELPFDDKCSVCQYTFTFTYKKRKDRYKKTDYGIRGGKKEKIHYIEYDGIKPTRPKPPRAKSKFTSRELIPKDLRDAVWNRDEGKCTQCDSKEYLEFDHIIPISKGGANTYNNIQILCRKCNRRKSDEIG
tara:strand:- start:48 stop:1076 length:1029 start_codon:yes stop_codon:yes gene_type:complete